MICTATMNGNSRARPEIHRHQGRRYLWLDIVKLRQEQCRAAAEAQQPALFDLSDDHRSVTERGAAERYREPSLFSLLER